MNVRGAWRVRLDERKGASRRGWERGRRRKRSPRGRGRCAVVRGRGRSAVVTFSPHRVTNRDSGEKASGCGSSEVDDQDKLPRLSPAPRVRAIVLLRAGRTPTRPVLTRGAGACPGWAAPAPTAHRRARPRPVGPTAPHRPDRAPSARPRPIGPTARRTAPRRRPIPLPFDAPFPRTKKRSGPTTVGERGSPLPPQRRKPTRRFTQIRRMFDSHSGPAARSCRSRIRRWRRGCGVRSDSARAKSCRIRCLLWAPGAAPTPAYFAASTSAGRISGAVASSSSAFAINAAAISPLMCAWRSFSLPNTPARVIARIPTGTWNSRPTTDSRS